MIKELDRVILTRAVPVLGLCAGDVGTVVFVHDGNVAYEVEFVTTTGKTLGVVELEAAAVRPLTNQSRVWNARELATTT